MHGHHNNINTFIHPLKKKKKKYIKIKKKKKI